jgi:alginate O-acetyltransferase complex protein AlgI
VWGLYHGALLIIERGFGWDSPPARFVVARRALTFLLVVFGWVLFRSPDMAQALTMIGHMLLPDFTGLTDVVGEALTNQRLAILVAALAIAFMPAHPVTGPLLESSQTRAATVLRVSVMTVGLFYAAVLTAAGTFSPFLYYQF